jgi:3-phenylpropionate/cinnamic acid dioxygenase small subunit
MRMTILALAAAQALSACSPAAEAQGSDDLAARVQALEDEKEIRRVLVHYGEYLDARDYRAYSQLFARDGVWTGGFGSFTGPAAIEAMLGENMGAREPGFINRDNFHLMTTMVVDVTGETAEARSRYLFFTRTPEDRPSIALAGRYEDTLVREDGAWKIQRRITHGVIPYRDGAAPPPAERPAQLAPGNR